MNTQNDKPCKILNLFTAVCCVVIIGLLIAVLTGMNEKYTKLEQEITDISNNVTTIPDMFQSIDDRLVAEFGAVDQSIANMMETLVSVQSSVTSPQPLDIASLPVINLGFVCKDDSTKAVVEGCKVTLKILSVEPATELSIITDRPAPYLVPVKVRLAISAEVKGYQPYATIYEYVENGESNTFDINLVK